MRVREGNFAKAKPPQNIIVFQILTNFALAKRQFLGFALAKVETLYKSTCYIFALAKFEGVEHFALAK